MSKTINIVNKYNNVVSYKTFQPSYAFYLPERIQVFQKADSLKFYLEQNKAVVITRLEFIDELKTTGLKQLAAHHDLFEYPTTLILANE